MVIFRIVRNPNKPVMVDRFILYNPELTADQKLFTIYLFSLDSIEIRHTNEELANDFQMIFNLKKPVSRRHVQRTLKKLHDLHLIRIELINGYIRTIYFDEVN